jgi:hypothetical protein
MTQSIKDGETLTPKKKTAAKKPQTKAVTKTKPKAPAVNQGMDFPALFAEAVKNPNAAEVMERLTALKNREEDRAAKKEFDLHFAEMQREFKLVPKDKDGSKTTSGNVAFKYAPIENYQAINGDAIAKYKFSYKWTEKLLEGGVLQVRIHISGYGHTDSDTYTDVPVIQTNSLTTESQARNAQKGVGKRITFADGFGMVTIGEDMYNSLTFEDGTEYADLEQRYSACTTIEAANATGQAIKRELEEKGDEHGLEVNRKLYVKRKKELTK